MGGGGPEGGRGMAWDVESSAFGLTSSASESPSMSISDPASEWSRSMSDPTSNEEVRMSAKNEGGLGRECSRPSGLTIRLNHLSELLFSLRRIHGRSWLDASGRWRRQGSFKSGGGVLLRGFRNGAEELVQTCSAWRRSTISGVDNWYR
jgi:hypothetical protein